MRLCISDDHFAAAELICLTTVSVEMLTVRLYWEIEGLSRCEKPWVRAIEQGDEM